MNKTKTKQFIKRWKDRGDEKQDTQKFWMDFTQNVLGINPYSLDFEKRSAKKTRGNNFIDVYVNAGPEKKVIIEQKSLGVDLNKAARQSDGSLRTPFEQAEHYNHQLAASEMANWIITSNFGEFWIYDLERTGKDRYQPVQKIRLEELTQYPDAFDLLIPGENQPRGADFHKEVAVSVEATKYIRIIYDELEKAYQRGEPGVDRSEDLNKLAVRLVFLLYAEDAGLLIHKDTMTDFWNYIKDRKPEQIRQALRRLFKVLNTPIGQRDPYLYEEDPVLAAMPYVNGGLFKDEIVIPVFNQKMKDALREASLDFNWMKISPTIFGAMFESTLNPEKRRAGGMHYTSIENIHKVIDPLFLDDLKAELEEIRKLVQPAAISRRVQAFREKLAGLKFLDPAMGSGNFLTETFISLRRLENEALKLTLTRGEYLQGALDLDLIMVSIDQFYGIEINGFACSVASTAIVLAEHQMMRETEKITDQKLEFLPLRTHENFHEGNALRMDWNDVVPANTLSYIVGNPPFISLTNQAGNNSLQKQRRQELIKVFKDKKVGKLDYVTGWFKKASDLIELNKKIKAGFVSTNSVTQGEQANILWKHLYDVGIIIPFAYRSFLWTSEATDKASVTVVIIALAHRKAFFKKAVLFDKDGKKEVSHINGYLVEGPDIVLKSRNDPPDGIPKITKGNLPWDNGGLIIKSLEEKERLVKRYPVLKEIIRPYIGSYEFLNKKDRFCLWFLDEDNQAVDLSKFRKIPEIQERLHIVSEKRKSTTTKAVQAQAATPYLFSQIRQPRNDFLFIPEVTSENREYIPVGFCTQNIIPSNKGYVTEEANLYIFGTIISTIHMAWVKAVTGRLKNDYSYSSSVYNNFPWPDPTPQQKAEIEKTAQEILDARGLYPDSSLADLYDPLTMPPELRKAHEANDRAVMKAYGMKSGMDESEILAKLFEMYQKKVEESV